MSRETLLDDAIAKAKADEDWQLVEWLRMARGGESAARWYTAKLGEARLDMSKLMTENAKLRHDLEEANNQAEEVCIENAKLREELADAPKCETCEAMLDCDECLRADGSHKERRRLSAENAKLRECLQDLAEHIREDDGFGLDYGWMLDRMRELGVD